MSFPSTPQRPMAGAYVQTPAISRFNPGPSTARQLFPQTSTALQPANPQQQSQVAISGDQQKVAQPLPTQAQSVQPVQRAARTINDVLLRDASFPDLDTYVKQGISSDYDLPWSASDRAWAPFERGKKYEIPDKIYDQINASELQITMGLFAELNHAWAAIDNALYLWDYTQTNPELLGYEEQPNSITAVKLIIPRPGVFIPAITHILVVATTLDIQLIGVSAITNSTGAKSLALYATGMSQSTKGVSVNTIQASASTGRIFFGGVGDNELYELTYQQEEKWFSSRTSKINHTSSGYSSLMPLSVWSSKAPERIEQIVVDDTRNLVYTLSSDSSIRIFHMDTSSSLNLVVTKTRQEVLRDMSHMISQTPLLGSGMTIVSINAISAREAGKLHLMAVTSTGCRIFLSATRGYGYLPGRGEAPTSMQVQHIKFPPKEQGAQQARSPQRTPMYAGGEAPIDTTSAALQYSRKGYRYPPGLFICFIDRGREAKNDVMFLSAPDTGRIAFQSREPTGVGIKYYETGIWMNVEGVVEDIGLSTKIFSAAETPRGFGNELAVQYDEVSTEVAILTNLGIQTIRRRRLVDIFAAAIRYGGGEEGFEGEVKRFIRQFGRGETTAAALAVACGQGADISSSDARVVKVTDPATLEAARKAFVEHGGKPRLNENVVSDGQMQAIDHVLPSARHEGLALYITRIVRSLWKAPVVSPQLQPGGQVVVSSTVAITKLRNVQEDLTKLDVFLDSNSTFIEGLSGPEGLQRAGSKQEEIALQGEHQALHSLQALNKNIIEGISFVMMLFDERVDELFASLDDTTKQQLRDLTYESLFATNNGKDLGKLLVKAIVNRNIANGSNVDTVADALRRKCKSFCSAGDVMIFKAQEQLKRASELGANTEIGRNVLNESLRLFNQVAGDLTPENLSTTVKQYVDLQFYAGSIQLALNVAKETDRGNKALSWVKDNKPDNDSRVEFYNRRKHCYNLIHDILVHVDDISRRQPEMMDGRYTVTAVKRNEAYTVVNGSDDELFQYDLFEWYLTQGWEDRILAVDSDYAIAYLQRIASTTIDRADLLWKYYAHKERFFDAASVQLELAKSDFPIGLKLRIEYLSRAKANASTHTSGVGRQARHVLLHEITGMLDIANIQDDILQKIKSDSRFDDYQRQDIVKRLDGPIQDLTELFNKYADAAGYFGICLIIFQAADHRNPAEIKASWMSFLEFEHGLIDQQGEEATQLPYEHIITSVTDLAHRLQLSDSIFNAALILPLLEKYAFESQFGIGPPTWVMDLLLNIGIPHESIVHVLEGMFYDDVEPPFNGPNRIILANHMVYVIKRWFEHCQRTNLRTFGGHEQAARVSQQLSTLAANGLQQPESEIARDLITKIARSF